MSNTLLGYQKRSYVSNKTGKQVTGYNVYFSYPQANMQGVACDRAWVSPDVFESVPLAVGDEIEFLYNRFGTVTAIQIV